MPSIETLKQRLAQTLRAKKFDAALGAIDMLERMQPTASAWPRRAARLMHATSDFKGELIALRRALDLQVDEGLVLDAIASCKAILALAPEDDATLETLDLLYLNRQPFDLGTSLSHGGRNVSADEPLDSLLLTKVVPGARSIPLANAEPGQVNEIPIESTPESEDDEIPNLRLDEWSPSDHPDDLAAAQAVSLPTVADKEAMLDLESHRRGASLRNELANTPLFGDLDPASLHTLIQRVRVVSLAAGQVLFHQGDAANSLYVVVAGAVVPIAEGDPRRKLAVLENGEFFGEIGVMTKQPRGATIEALVDTKLLAIDRRVLWELIANESSVAKSILRFLRARMIDRQIRTNLFFAAFAHGEREAVARQFRVLEVKDGTPVIEQGKPAGGLFVVLSGSLVRIERDAGKEVGEFGLGDVFGGLSLLEGQPASSDVVSRGKCWLVVLGEGRFRRIVEANPRLVRIIKRLASDSTQHDEGPRIAAL